MYVRSQKYMYIQVYTYTVYTVRPQGVKQQLYMIGIKPVLLLELPCQHQTTESVFIGRTWNVISRSSVTFHLLSIWPKGKAPMAL